MVFSNLLIQVYDEEERSLQDLTSFFCYYTDYLFESLNSLGVFLMLVSSVDRLYAVVNPMFSRMFITNKYPTTITLVIYFLLLLVKYPQIKLYPKEYQAEYDILKLTIFSFQLETIIRLLIDLFLIFESIYIIFKNRIFCYYYYIIILKFINGFL